MHMERQGGQQELLGADRAKRGVFVTPGFRVQWPITEDLATLRRRLRAFGIAAELTEQRLSDLVLAANEAASIVLRHGSERGSLIAWSDGAVVSVEVVDVPGAVIETHLGMDPAPFAAGRELGLWVIHRVCDKVSIDDSDGRFHLCLSLRRSMPETVSA